MRLPSITIAAFLMSSVFDAVKILSTITTVDTFVPFKIIEYKTEDVAAKRCDASVEIYFKILLIKIEMIFMNCKKKQRIIDARLEYNKC
jgi:hypothetical protein